MPDGIGFLLTLANTITAVMISPRMFPRTLSIPVSCDVFEFGLGVGILDSVLRSSLTLSYAFASNYLSANR